MASTFRQILKNVLVNIGSGNSIVPASGTAITDPYQLMVCNYINHIKEEIENATNWRCLWVTYNVAYVAGNITQQIIDLTQGGVGGVYASPNSTSRVARMYNRRFGREVALCFDTTTFGIPFILSEMPLADIYYFNTVLNQTPVAYSTNFAVQDQGNDQMNLVMYPGANANRNIQITMITPQPRIDATLPGGSATIRPWFGTVGLDSPILIPNFPLELGASWYALQERGESLGIGSMFSQERFLDALDDAISRDVGESGGLEMIVA
jgi:hypothetical protein